MIILFFDFLGLSYFYTVVITNIMAQIEVELENFQDGKPLLLKSNEAIVNKIKVYKARKEYKKLLELAATMPNSKERYLLQIHAFLHLKKWSDLYEACERGLSLEDQQLKSEFFNLKGKASGKLGNHQEKIKLTILAIQIDDKVAAYHRNLGSGYYKLKQYQKAIQSHNRAISLQPKNPINYHNKGAAYFRMQELSGAVSCFQKATQLDSKQVMSFVWLADTYKELQQYENAKDNYLHAYELTDEYEYKQQAQNMKSKLQPDRKKGLFQRIFG